MIELPWRCSACGYENMVDMMNLSTWLVEGSLSQKGFVCSKCGTREAVLYTNASIDEAVRKLTRYPPGHRKFQFLFSKLVLRVEAVQKRGEAHGAVNASPKLPIS